MPLQPPVIDCRVSQFVKGKFLYHGPAASRFEYFPDRFYGVPGSGEYPGPRWARSAKRRALTPGTISQCLLLLASAPPGLAPLALVSVGDRNTSGQTFPQVNMISPGIFRFSGRIPNPNSICKGSDIRPIEENKRKGVGWQVLWASAKTS